MKVIDELLQKAQSLPLVSGCYLMRDRNGNVIYVGKAKKLRSRVVTYFNNTPKSLKTEYMVSHVKDFDFFITNSEAESLVLENNLIKEHSPKYNIRLRDDKSYPYLMVSKVEPFPRLEYVRRPKKNKNYDLFGPFPTGSNIFQIIRVLTKSFGLRDCSLSEFKSRKTACLYYQMGQCSAPCVDYISVKDYQRDLSLALEFFQGKEKAKSTLNFLRDKMAEFSENEEFERAGLLRDHILILEQFLSQSYEQNVELLKNEKDIDVWSTFVGNEEVDFSLYVIRNGLLLGQKNFHFVKSEFLEEMVEEFQLKIFQYYSESQDSLPEFVVIDGKDEEFEQLSIAIKQISEIKLCGKSKRYGPLLDMCRKHAFESQRIRLENQESSFVGLNKLKELLELKERPRILECYDVAVWQGISPTASQIVFEEGKADKTKYRYYHLEQRPEGNNDFAMMREVLQRRLKKEQLPDVFVIDGGVAQVNTVLEVLKEFNIRIPVVGIAKSKELTRGNFKNVDLEKSEERLIIPGRSNPYFLKKCPSLFRIIVQMRDEAHRFSRKLHHKAESDRLFLTWPDEIEGLNADTKRRILSVSQLTKDEVKKMTIQDMVNLFEIKTKQAELIYRFFHNSSLRHE